MKTISDFIKELNLTYELPIYIFITITATFMAAIIAQILGQFLSHFLSSKRSKRSFFMEVYQELYSDVIPSISNYMAIKTNPRKYHDIYDNVVEGDLLDITIATLEERLKYASPVLLNVYERYQGYGYYEDGRGNNPLSEKHILVYFLLGDILNYSNSTGVFNTQDRKRLKKLRQLYGIAAMSLDVFDMDKTELILTSHGFFGVNKFKGYYSKRYDKTLISLNSVKMSKHLLRYLSLLKEDGKKALQDEIFTELKRYTNK